MTVRDLSLTVKLVNQLSGQFKKVAEDIRKESVAANKVAVASAQKTSDETKKIEAAKQKELVRMQRASVSIADKQAKELEAIEERSAKQRISLQRSSINQMDRQQEAAFRQRISLQRSSIATQDRLAEAARKEELRKQQSDSVKSLQVSRNQSEVADRIQKQAALAEASLVENRFDRRMAIERTKHTQIMATLKGNHIAEEAEKRRHRAVMSRLDMDKAGFSNTPFQVMLKNFEKLNQKIGAAGPAVMTMAGNFGTASKAAGFFGEALGSLAMGPIGVAVAAITGLSMGLNLLIERAERAANLKANMGQAITDPAQLKAMIAAMDRYDNPRAGRTAVGDRKKASADFKAMTGETIEDYRSRGGPDLRQQEGALERQKEGRLKNAEDVKRLEIATKRAAVEAIQNEEKRALGLQKIAYEEEIRAAKQNKYQLQAAEAWNAQIVRNIRAEAHRKLMEEKEKEARENAELEDRAAVNAIAREDAFQKARKARLDKAAEDKKKSKADEFKTEQFYNTKQREMDALMVQQRNATFMAMADIATTLVGPSKAALAMQRIVALAQIAMNTGVAATAAVAPPPLGAGPVAGLPLSKGIIALGGLQAANVLAQTVMSFNGYARGTSWSQEGYAWVGEHGRELMKMPRGATVVPHNESEKMAQGGGGEINMGGINITIQGNADASTARQVGAVTNRELREMARRMEMIKYRGIKG